MYDSINKLAMDVVKVANKTGRQALATEIFSCLPVEDRNQFELIRSQVGVVRTLIRLRPTLSKRLVESVQSLTREIEIVVGCVREPRCRR